jgi:TonB family protein
MRHIIILIFILTLFLNKLSCQEGMVQYVDEVATFQGHDIKYFRDNFVLPKIQYPDSAKINCIQGKVFVIFTVDSIGYISETKVLRSVNYLCDNEVVRVIKLSSGMWNPAKINGKNVNQSYTIPVDFKLTKSDCKD